MDRQSHAQLYHPLISTMDRKTRMPLKPWRHALFGDLQGAVISRNMDLKNIAPVLNELALLEAYQGNNENALRLCSAQIVFWKNLSLRKNEKLHLSFAIQPWINILRLDRWSNKMGSASALYRDLSPENRVNSSEFNRRFGIESSLGELSQFPETGEKSRMLDFVYWKEYGRLLLDSSCHDELQRHLSAGLSDSHNTSRLSLLEILLVYQMRVDKYEAALALLEKMDMSPASNYWLHFKVMEMYLHVKLGAETAKSLATQVSEVLVSGAHISHDAYGLNLLVDICRVYRLIEMPDSEVVLLQKALELARALNDEFLSFQVMNQLCSLKQVQQSAVLEQFQHSTYSGIRRTLGLGDVVNGDVDLSRRIVQAVSLLAELNFSACEELLSTEDECTFLV